MLEGISDRLESVFKNLAGKGKLTEKNIKDGVREVKLALLEADVNYTVVKDFTSSLTEKVVGEKVLTSVNPTQQFIYLVHAELVRILGSKNAALNIKPRGKGTSVILMVGLQGSGKTTSAAKLANLLKENNRVLLVGADIHRPAAKEQLRILSEQVGVGFHTEEDESAAKIVKNALKYANSQDFNIIIVDTAGRLQIDEKLMQEVEDIKKISKPDEILFVSDAMAGQSVVDVISTFDKRLKIDGIILTKFDSDTRGGAVMSAKLTTGKPVKFIGVGEKITELEPFHPERMANRILGQGDLLTLAEKVQKVVSEKDSKKMQKKMMKGKFSLDDYLVSLQKMKSAGSMSSLMKMIPGANKIKDDQIDDKSIAQMEAIILSMTPKERQDYRLVTGTRLRRIARGSGQSQQNVLKLIKQFAKTSKLMKMATKNPLKMQKMLKQQGFNLDQEGLGL